MATYARIENGAVAELLIVPAGSAIGAMFNPAMTWVECDATPGVAQGWLYAGGAFTAPPAAAGLTLAQQAASALTVGYSISLSGSITLASTVFPTDPVTQSKIMAVMATISATGTFAAGATSFPMKDSAGGWHTFTISEYKAVATAIDAYATALTLIADGNPLAATTLPPASIALSI